MPKAVTSKRHSSQFDIALVDPSVRNKLQEAIAKYSPAWIGTDDLPYGGADCVGANDLSRILGGRACEAKCRARHHPANWECPNQTHRFTYYKHDSWIRWDFRCYDCTRFIQSHRDSVIRNTPVGCVKRSETCWTRFKFANAGATCRNCD
ncbi:hypothetical protein RQP46_011160 [Phenoliferia psychrophenolica]